MTIKLDPRHKDCVVTGFEEFVASINLSKYEVLKPNRGRVIIKQYDYDPSQNTSNGGIILSDEKEDKQEVGIVVAVGVGPFNPTTGQFMANEYSVGDVVFFPDNFGHTVAFGDGRDQIISILETDIIARLS